MQILFCRSSSLGSRIVRAFTWSRWSHCALVHEAMVVEAIWPKVRTSPVAALMLAYPDWALVDLPCRFPDLAWAAALSQMGKPYDWRALVGVLFHRDWAASGAWFCSELVAWAFAQGGSPIFRPEALNRVTPQDLWMVAPSLTPTPS